MISVPAAGGRAEQDVSLLHLDQRGEDRRPGAGGPASEQGVQEPGGEVHRDGRRRGQHLLRQHEGLTDELEPHVRTENTSSAVMDHLFPQVADHVHYNPPALFLPSFLSPFTRHSRSVRSLFHDPFQGFQSLFSPMMGMGKNFFGSMDSMMDMDTDTAPNQGTKENLLLTTI